jgi:hypothetical protein
MQVLHTPEPSVIALTPLLLSFYVFLQSLYSYQSYMKQLNALFVLSFPNARFQGRGCSHQRGRQSHSKICRRRQCQPCRRVFWQRSMNSNNRHPMLAQKLGLSFRKLSLLKECVQVEKLLLVKSSHTELLSSVSRSCKI